MNSRQQKKLKSTTSKVTDIIKTTENNASIETAPAVEIEAAPAVTVTDTEPEKEASKAETEAAAPAKKASAKTAKTAPKKAAAPKAEAKKELIPSVYIQYAGNETALENITELAKQAYVDDGHRVSSIKSLNIYVKPEENAAYYVINEKFAGKVDLF